MTIDEEAIKARKKKRARKRIRKAYRRIRVRQQRLKTPKLVTDPSPAVKISGYHSSHIRPLAYPVEVFRKGAIARVRNPPGRYRRGVETAPLTPRGVKHLTSDELTRTIRKAHNYMVPQKIEINLDTPKKELFKGLKKAKPLLRKLRRKGLLGLVGSLAQTYKETE